MGIRVAQLSDLEQIYAIFRLYPEWFSHIDRYYLRHQINQGYVAFESGCVLISRPILKTYQIGTCTVHKGDVKLCQLVTKTQGDSFIHTLFQKWLSIYQSKNIWLTVQPNNTRAKRFYMKYDFSNAGRIVWKYLSGEVWYRKKNDQSSILHFFH